MFKEYKSIPMKIKAIQFTYENRNEIFDMIYEKHNKNGDKAKLYYKNNDTPILEFNTMHGDTARARLGDWIVEDEKDGTYYPIKDSVFNKKYKEI